MRRIVRETIFVTKVNETYMQVGASDDGIIRELREFFTFEVPGAKYSPRVRNHIWDGKIRLFRKDHTLYLGLYGVLKQFAKDMNYTINELSEILPERDVSFEQYRKFVSDLDLHSNGYKITPYDYQDSTMIHCLNNERVTIISPTASGKSLSIYMLSVWNQIQNKKVLIVVPTVQLVSQLYSDFSDYSSEIEWSAQDTCHKIYSGQEKQSNKPIVISTWQSLQNMKANYFHQFKTLIVDECHRSAAKELTKIGERSKNAAVRYGFTGTLQDTPTNKLTIVGLFGPEKRIITTNELMEQGFVTKLVIKCLILKYNTADRKELRNKVLEAKKKDKKTGKAGSGYATEIKYINQHARRMQFLINLANVTKGNTLVLFQHVESHGKVIYSNLLQKTTKDVYYVSGETPVDEREEIRRKMEKSNNIVTVASNGVFSVGINIKNIENIIFASPTKSEIKVLQSIGRGLRLLEGKKVINLFDIVDEITYYTKKTKRPNYAFNHFQERFRIYKQEQFKIAVYERNL